MSLNLNTPARLIVLGALLLTSAAAWSAGATYPSRPIRIVTSEAGGGNDIIARIIAEGINSSLSQRAVVDNRGRVLSEDLRQDPTLGSATSQMKYRQQVEDYYNLLRRESKIYF